MRGPSGQEGAHVDKRGASTRSTPRLQCRGQAEASALRGEGGPKQLDRDSAPRAPFRRSTQADTSANTSSPFRDLVRV